MKRHVSRLAFSVGLALAASCASAQEKLTRVLSLQRSATINETATAPKTAFAFELVASSAQALTLRATMWLTTTQVATTAQALTLRSMLASASVNNPSLMAVRLESRATAEQIVAAERQRWPSISAAAETKSSGSSGSARFLRIQQSLWDGGRKSAKIDEAKTQSDISLINIDVQQQDLFIQVVTAWQNLVGAHARIKVAESALRRLLAYQAQMTRRVDAQASPAIDLELVNARLLQTHVELVTAKNSQRAALIQLEQLTVTTGLVERVNLLELPPTVESTQPFVAALSNMAWESVASESPAVAKARLEVTLSRNRLDARRADKWPELYARLDQPIGPSNGTGTAKPTAFIGLSYTPGSGFASFSEEQAQAIRVDSQEQILVSSVRSIQSTLLNDQLDFVNARARIVSLDKSVSGSALVLESYQRQFQAGRKTWQDLLNAVRELAQNEYAVADAQAVMQGAMHRLEIRMGQSPHFP